MKKTETFLFDLGAEMLAVFNDKIAAWSLTNPIELALNTEGGAGFQLSDFERLEKLAELPVRLNSVFIPDDLFDFEVPSEYLDTHESRGEVQSLSAKVGGVSENPNLKGGINERRSIFFQDVRMDKSVIGDNDRDIEPEKRDNISENNEKMPQILRGKEGEKNEDLQTQFMSKNDDKAFRKTIFSDIPEDNVKENVEKCVKDNAEEIISTIWQKPLGNLGAFGALANYSEQAKMPTNISFSSAHTTTHSAVFNTMHNVDSEILEQKLDKIGARQKQQLLENKPLENTQEEQFREGTAVLFEPVFHEEKRNRQSENTEFVPIDNDDAYKFLNSTTSPDDLLDALTERIKQDFQRFYP